MSLQQTLQKTTKDKIATRWKNQGDASSTIIDAFALGFSRAVESALKSGSGVGSITGGAAPPAGPVVGATCVFSAGTITIPPLQFSSFYKPPVFTLVRAGQPPVIETKQTPWMRKFVSTLAKAIDAAWLEWFQQWTGTTTAQGGVAGWISSSPPAPGPWAGGTITECVLSTGTSSSQKMKLLDTTMVRELRATTITVSIEGGEDMTVPMSSTPESDAIAKAVAGGMSDAFFELTKMVSVQDPTGSGASGTAMPGGVIVGGIINCVLAQKQGT